MTYSLKGYLHDKVLFLIIGLVALFLIDGALLTSTFPVESIAFVSTVFLGAEILVIAYDYQHRRRFYNELMQSSSQLDKGYLIADVLDAPDFMEGRLAYAALAKAGKDMADEVAQYRAAVVGHRDYVEAWVHEIKTPLAAASLIVENGTGGIDPTVRSDLTVELERIDAHVEQALYFARSTDVSNDYLIKRIGLLEIVHATLHKNARLLIAAGFMPTIDMEDIDVYTDAKWMGFILGQVIANAVRYRQTNSHGLECCGDIEHTIDFRARMTTVGRDAHRVVLQVRDNGMGINEADLPRVFEKGFTGDNGRTRAKSTGMGLFLCKTLCDAMGVGITVTSDPGCGTTVSFTFPQSEYYTGVLGSETSHHEE
jgi:signal transduction histidine kinase